MRFHYYLPILLIILSFTPYVLPGIRLEHIFIYPFIVLLCLYILAVKRKELYKTPTILMAFFLTLFIVLSLRSLLDRYISFGDTLGGIESTLMPAAILLIFSFKFFEMSHHDSAKIITLSCKTLIMMLVLNTLWIFTGMYIDVTNINEYFWGSSDSVASRAATNARYSGIFNQPMEAGVAYSLGLLAWLYLMESQYKVKLKNMIILGALLIGGSLSVSKVFVFGGIALFITGLLLSKKIIRRPFRLFFGSLIILVPGYFYLQNNWAGLDRLLNYFTSGNLSLSYFTAGRFGGDSSQQAQLFSAVWEDNPLLGSGFGLSVYDSAYFFYFGTGGMIALLIYISLLLVLIYYVLKFLNINKFGPESRMLMLIIVLIVGAGFGAPVFALNRVSIITLVFIGLLTRHYSLKNSTETSPDTVKNTTVRKAKYYKIV